MTKFAEVLRKVHEMEPRVQCITNFVTVNDCANIILAAGGTPSMADHIDEVAEALSCVQALVCNMGAIALTDSMIVGGKEANRRKIPVVLDPVAVGGTQLRRDAAKRLLEEVQFTAIRGNASEIRYLAGQQTTGAGVDVSDLDAITEENLPEAQEMIKNLAKSLGTVIAVSGVIDLVSDGRANHGFEKWMRDHVTDHRKRVYADFHDRCICRSGCRGSIYSNLCGYGGYGNCRRDRREKENKKWHGKCYFPYRFDRCGL